MNTKSRKHAHTQDTTKRYSATKKGIWWLNTKNQWVPLSNFRAKIRADIIRDDGTGGERLYELEVRLGNETKRFYVEASKFPNMQWVAENIGAAGNISAGYTSKDNLRAAIQTLSSPVSKTVYSHLGWRKCSGQWVYLHAGGVIAEAGAKEAVKVDIGDLNSYVLPAPPKDRETP